MKIKRTNAYLFLNILLLLIMAGSERLRIHGKWRWEMCVTGYLGSDIEKNQEHKLKKNVQFFIILLQPLLIF